MGWWGTQTIRGSSWTEEGWCCKGVLAAFWCMFGQPFSSVQQCNCCGIIKGTWAVCASLDSELSQVLQQSQPAGDGCCSHNLLVP